MEGGNALRLNPTLFDREPYPAVALKTGISAV